MKHYSRSSTIALAAVGLCVAMTSLAAPAQWQKAGQGRSQRMAATQEANPEIDNVKKLDKPYAPLMAVIGGGCMGPFTDEQIQQIADTWQMVNSHGGMLYHDEITRGVMPFWAGTSCEKDGEGRSNGQRIKAIKPDFVISNYRNGSYIAQFCPNEAEEVETRFPLGISIWNTSTTLQNAVGAEDTTIKVKKFPGEVPQTPEVAGGRPDYYPFKKSTTDGEHTKTTKEYVAWVRLGDEILRIDDISATEDGVEMQVQRGIWGTEAAAHEQGAMVYQPVYIGRNMGIDQGDSGLGGKPDDPSNQPGLRYGLMTFHPKMHEWLGEKAKMIFDEGYDVCWLDVTVSTWYNNANAYGDQIQPWNIRKNQLLTQDDYREWQQEKNDALYAMFPDGKFWINNVKGSVYFDNGNDRYQLSGENGHHPVDGGSMEMYANHRGNEPAWIQTANMTLDFVTSDFNGVAWSKGRDDMDYRRFSYATYLLAYEPDADLYFAIGEGGGLLSKPRDLFYYDLGQPTQSFKTIDEAEVKDGLYARDFTNGKVVVNPGMEPQTLELDKPYIDSSTGETIEELSLRGNTAAVLLLPTE